MVYVTNIKQLTLELAGAFMVVFCLFSLHLVDCTQTLMKYFSGPLGFRASHIFYLAVQRDNGSPIPKPLPDFISQPRR